MWRKAKTFYNLYLFQTSYDKLSWDHEQTFWYGINYTSRIHSKDYLWLVRIAIIFEQFSFAVILVLYTFASQPQAMKWFWLRLPKYCLGSNNLCLGSVSYRSMEIPFRQNTHYSDIEICLEIQSKKIAWDLLEGCMGYNIYYFLLLRESILGAVASGSLFWPSFCLSCWLRQCFCLSWICLKWICFGLRSN